MSDKECTSLPCFRDGNQVISKWELSEEEKAHIAKHGFIWVSVLGGWSQPPILPQACETVFEPVRHIESNELEPLSKSEVSSLLKLWGYKTTKEDYEGGD